MKATELAVSQQDCWRKIASLTTPLPVQYFFSTLLPALMKERHFALAENVANQLNMARPTKARS